MFSGVPIRVRFDNGCCHEYRSFMSGRLKDEIQQTKEFESIEEEVLLNLMRTSDAVMRDITLALKPFRLSPTQYNVLRILRGAGAGGLACGSIADRMVTRDPDITRLLDRMEKRGVISRSRETRDRRVITARITTEGLDVLRAVNEQNPKLAGAMLGHMGERRLRALCSLLEQVRCKNG